MHPMKFDVFGRKVLIHRTGSGWKVDYLSDQGKKRPATDVIIPDFITEDELEQYLTDLFHEGATEEHPEVRRIG